MKKRDLNLLHKKLHAKGFSQVQIETIVSVLSDIKHDDASPEPDQPQRATKYQAMAQEFRENPVLTGCGEELAKLRQNFRKDFSNWS